MLVSSVDYNEFVGRIGIGRIQNGVAKVGEEVVVCDWHNPDLKMRGRLTKLYDFQPMAASPATTSPQAISLHSPACPMSPSATRCVLPLRLSRCPS